MPTNVRRNIPDPDEAIALGEKKQRYNAHNRHQNLKHMMSKLSNDRGVEDDPEELTNEYAEYAKSEAPKFTPSKTNANCVMQVHGTHDLCDCGYVLLSLKQKENALQFVSFEFISYLQYSGSSCCCLFIVFLCKCTG
ncbi:hypothetical protein SDJN02_12151, partial [Cucurbita argyrosperma subsp. argyrosperma]